MEDIQILYIIFGIIGLGFLSMSIFLGIHLWRRYKTRSVLFEIIGIDGKIKRKRINHPQEKNNVFSNTYIYDQECEVRDFWNKRIFYFEGIPNPIKFDRKNQKVTVTSKALNNIVEDDFIKKLFNPISPISLENILSYISIGLLVILFYFLVLDNIVVKLANDPTTIDIIKNACREAIIGG